MIGLNSVISNSLSVSVSQGVVAWQTHVNFLWYALRRTYWLGESSDSATQFTSVSES